ncbi:MAG: flagellar hook protein FlgE [Neorhizobium sp.]|nr:flagellar hook protein FlgE [Neorhizobium sp.]
MSLFGTMKTAVSGMNAQANRLGTVGDNISNSSTTGYKSASTSFSSLVLPSTTGSYNSGGVETSTSYSISEQGALEYTTSTTDMAVQGDGFFIVQDSSGATYLTRNGSFTKDESGNLVNDAGYTLMGYSYDSGTPTTVVNSYDGLVPVNVSGSTLNAVASTSGSLSGNLNSAAETAAVSASNNDETVDVDQSSVVKTSLTTYDALGNTVVYDLYFSNAGDGNWDVSVYNAADAATSGSGSFPYSSSAVASGTLTFDATGKNATLTTTDVGANSTSLMVDGISIDLASMTQLSAASNISSGSVNGSAPSAIKSVTIDSDGTVNAVYTDGSSKALYQIPLATVASPDNLTVLSGNVFQTSSTSGVVTMGFAGSSGFGSIISGALETSNVDLASELTDMIEAQRSYSANSKVFQTGSDLMDTLINLVR